MKSLVLLLTLLLCSPLIRAQTAYADSLKTALTKNIPDTSRVKTLIALCKVYMGSDSKLAFHYVDEAKKEARKAKYSSGLATAYRYSGTAYYYHGQLKEALGDWQIALHLFDSAHNALGMANIFNNIGSVHFEQGEFALALENYHQSLKLSQQVGDQLSIATAMVNIGVVYMDKDPKHRLALEYYSQALQIAEKINHTRTISAVCSNLGQIYLARKQDTLAQKYFLRALDKLRGSDLEPSVLLGLAKVELYRKNFPKALVYQREAYSAAIEYGNLMYATQSLIAQAKLLFDLGKKDLALINYKMAMPLALEIGANLDLRDIYQGLATIYSENLTYDSAYKYLGLYGSVKDAIFNESSEKRLSDLRLDFELERKESQIEQLTTVNDLNAKIIQRQNTIRNLITVGLFFILIFLYIALRQKSRIGKEKQRSEELLLNILPFEIAEELKKKGNSEARNFSEVTVLFTDFMDFTDVAQVLDPQELVFELNEYFKAFDEIITRHGIEKIKTIGDAYMAVGGMPKQDKDAVIKVVQAALEMQEFVTIRQQSKALNQDHYFRMRLGIHTGSVVAGIVGVKKFQYDIWGDTVNTASRMESFGEPGIVNISQDTYERIKHLDDFLFVKRDKIQVKGKGEMQMFFVSKANAMSR